MSRLTRPARGDGRVIAGVAAAVADGIGLSRTVVRVLFLVAGLVGAGEIVYLVLWVLLPKRT
jgi:phage shock protein C